MQTTFIFKTDKNLRDKAKAAAQDLGVQLTTVINALLKQFVRDRKIVISSEPSPSREKIALWESISAEMDTVDHNRDQDWFWSRSWQKKEGEADEDLRDGRSKKHKNMVSIVHELEQLS